MKFISLSPLNRRRLDNFRANRRGYWSFWIFFVLFSVSLLADFIANDKPLLIWYEGSFYMPIFVSYPETLFGGFLESETEYKDVFVQEQIEEGGWILWPPIPWSYGSYSQQGALQPPSSEHWLGTDDHGRDVLANIIYGFRISILFGLALSFLSTIIGITAGALQGYWGGWFDLSFQRFIEIWSGMPSLYILMILASFITPSFMWLLLILLLFSWVSLCGVVRAESLRVRNFSYVQAAKALGVSELRIVFRHILPNALTAALSFLPFILAGAITSLTSLDYLGLGLPPGSPSLGGLLLQGKSNLQAPWLGLAAFFTIAVMLSLLVFIGEAVRDALDPRKRH